MKRFGRSAFTAVLALVLVLSLAACGKKAGSIGPAQADTSAPGLLGNAVGAAATDSESGQVAQESMGAEQKRRQFLVEDRSLYEKMVRGRYYDVWSRRGTYFTNLDLFLYEQFLDKMQENIVASWDAELAGGLAFGQKADRETFLRLLTMLICQQSVGFSQAAETLTDYDTLKTLADYRDDLIEVGWDLVGTYVDTSLEQDLLLALGTELSDTAEHVKLTIEDYQTLREAAENYQNASRLLDIIVRNTESPALKEAAEDMQGILDRVRQGLASGDWKTQDRYIGEKAWEHRELFAEYVLEVLSAGPGNETWVRDLSESCEWLCDGIDSVAPGISLFQATYHAMMIGANGNFGTADTFNRFTEIRCLAEISSALAKEAPGLDWKQLQVTSGIKRIREAVPLLQFSLLTALRGEYCIRELVLNNGGLQSDLVDLRADVAGLFGKQIPKKGEISAWFEDEAEIFSEIYTDLDRILCTGDEVYYRYLQDVILPEVGWANLEEVSCPVSNWNVAGSGTSASHLKEYPKAAANGDSLGVLAACVQDFDGDNLKDMLVIYTEAVPEANTKISPVYAAEDAVALRFELFQMQYDAFLEENGAQEVPNTDPDTGPEAPFGQELQGIGGTVRNIPSLKELLTTRIPASSWRPIDRFTVYSSADVQIAAEIGGKCLGRVLAGVCSSEGVPYVYTYESMSDVTTDGPWLLRFWHVENGHFVLDYGDGLIGWGQGIREDNVSAFLGAGGMNITDTGLAVVGKLLQTAYSETTEAGKQLVESHSLLCRLDFSTKESGKVGGNILCQAKDYSMIREIIRNKDFARRIPGVPEFKPSENPWREQMDLLAEEIGAACGYPLTAANNSEDGGLFIVEYRSSSGQSALSVRVNESGKLCAVLLSSQEETEFLAIKDAVLSRESIPVDERVRTSLLGDCPYQNLDFPGGYAYVNRVASFVFGLDFDG